MLWAYRNEVADIGDYSVSVKMRELKPRGAMAKRILGGYHACECWKERARTVGGTRGWTAA